jgi:RNA polymerase sigma-70 factor (family 1)
MTTNPRLDIDTELLDLLSSGDTEAFRIIYQTYARGLYCYCRKNINKNEDCEEIIQEVFISLWERYGQLQLTSIRHYLFSAVRYKIIRYFQHNKVVRKYEEHYKFFGNMYEEPKESQNNIDVQEKIFDCLQHLPLRCQEAFALRLTQSLSNGEIAERMNISKKTVEVYMTKAFDHLRNSRKKILGAI